MELWKNEVLLEREYGEITRTFALTYYKYVFDFNVRTSLGYTLSMRVGGNADCIYRYDPHGRWSEHVAAEIQDLYVVTEPTAQGCSDEQ